MRLTMNNVNNAIRERGIDAELVFGDDYFYFVGTAVENAYSTTILVPRLTDYTFDRWMLELDRLVAESTARKPTDEPARFIIKLGKGK